MPDEAELLAPEDSGGAQPRRVSRVFARPATTLGWVSVSLLLAGIVLIIILPTVERLLLSGVAFGLQGPVVLGLWLGGAIVGFIAIFAKHERSWAVLLSSGLPLAVIALEFLAFE